MRRETIDTDAERGVVAQLLGQESPRTLGRLYAELRIEPDRIDRAITQLAALHIIDSDARGLALSATMRRLDHLDLLHV
jgi:hypothetical protein